MKRSGLLDKPFEPGCLYDRSGPEWGSVDLRNGTPLGDLFEALLYVFHKASDVIPYPVVDRPSGRPPFSEQIFAVLELRDDYAEAQERWPGQKLKPLCRLMCKHFTRYHKVNPDALRKRIAKMLKEGEWAKFPDAVHKAEVPQTQSIGDMIFDLKVAARGLAKRAEAARSRKNRRRGREKTSQYFEGF